MSKQFLLILAAIVVIFGGLLVVNKKKNDTGTTNGNNIEANLSEHKVEGDSGVTLIEYGDFQCPGCGGMYPVFKQLKQQYAGKVTFQFRHLPLVEIHPYALLAARAAEAAAMQGKFWEMHDRLFENQTVWSSSSNPSALFDDYAKQIELDEEKFKADMKSEQVNAIVQADRAEAKKQGYTGTPTFELDGEKISPRTLEDFQKLLDEALNEKQNQ